jgi:uncharacterized surface protein with fasciclin (FAS1) repeats
MSMLKATLITAGLLGAGLSVGEVEANRAAAANRTEPTDAQPALVQTSMPNAVAREAGGRSIYDEALAAATALRGVRASAAVGRPVSLEFITSLLRAASFGADRAAPVQWTLFLPTDAAFAPFAGRTLDTLIHNPTALRHLLDRHVLFGALPLDALPQGNALTTLGGQALTIVPGEMPRVNGATVLAEQRVGNDRIVIVDGLL